MSESQTNLNEKMEAIMAKNKTNKPRKTQSTARKLGSYWIKNSLKFVKELEGPSLTQYKQIFRLYVTGAVTVGVFCYAIKVIHIPINNTIVN